MPKPKIDPSARKRNMMGFYANDDLAAAITAAANAKNLPIAEWLRRMATKEITRIAGRRTKERAQ